MQNLFIWMIWLKVYCFPANVVALKRAGLCCMALVALNRSGCDVCQLECQANNVTASVQSDHLLHGHTLPVFFAIDQSQSQPHSAEIQPKSQQAAATNRSYRRLVLDTHAPTSCPRCDNLPGLDQDCWLATCQDWWTGVSHSAET